MFQFSCRFAFFVKFSSFKPDTKNNANFDAISSKCANFDEVQFLALDSIYAIARYMSSPVRLSVRHTGGSVKDG